MKRQKGTRQQKSKRNRVPPPRHVIPLTGWCRYCEKRAFDEKGVNDVVEAMRWRRVRVYECPYQPGWWHTTRMSWLSPTELYGEKEVDADEHKHEA